MLQAALKAWSCLKSKNIDKWPEPKAHGSCYPTKELLQCSILWVNRGKKYNLPPFQVDRLPGEHGEKQRLSEINPKFKTPHGCLQIAKWAPSYGHVKSRTIIICQWDFWGFPTCSGTRPISWAIMSHHEPSNISLPRWPTKAPPHRFLPGRLQCTLEWRNVAPLPLYLYIERERKKKRETGAVLACDLWSSTFYLLNEGHVFNILTLGMWVPDRKGRWPDWRNFQPGEV